MCLEYIASQGGDSVFQDYLQLRAADLAAECQRCGSRLKAGKCTDVTCPFSDHYQTCRRGWLDHPDHRVTGEKCSRGHRIVYGCRTQPASLDRRPHLGPAIPRWRNEPV